MDNAAVSHIHSRGPRLSLILSLCGQNARNQGKMNAIPAIAAYDSWKPTSWSACGSMTRCMSSEVMRTVPVFLKRLYILAVSPVRMKTNALTIDAPAPVARVYSPQTRIVAEDRIFCAHGEFPIMESDLLRMPYMIPRCRPDRANMCDAPLSLNALVMCFGISDLSPVIKALMIALVSGLLNEIVSMTSFVKPPHLMKCPDRLYVRGKSVERTWADIPQRIPHEVI